MHMEYDYYGLVLLTTPNSWEVSILAISSVNCKASLTRILTSGLFSRPAMLLNGSNNTPGTEHVTSYNRNQTSVLVRMACDSLKA